MGISNALAQWYVDNERPLPWRSRRDPYPIWLSEVIMQQTRVQQGTPYWEEFLRLFPDVHTLADAEEDEVLKAWEGLGYYSRARNLHKAAKMISADMDGEFPKDYNGLLVLPGVGPYIAAAIASICYGEEVPVVDGNVYRLLSRLHLIATPINTTKAFKQFSEKAGELLHGHEPRIINQAMMEYGATVCTYKKPSCGECVLRDDCRAHARGRIDQLPVKKAKKPVRHRELNYHFILHDGHTYIQQRGAGDVWQGLYEFPLVEAPLSEEPLIIGENDRLLAIRDATHILSHQHIKARFFVIETDDPTVVRAIGEGVRRVALEDLSDYAFARTTTRFLEEDPEWLDRVPGTC